MLALCVVLAGCGRQEAETQLPHVLSKAKTGHAYVPALMPAHPLYDELRALQRHIDALRGIRPPRIATQIGQPWDSPIIVPPALDEGIESFDNYWRAGPPAAEPEVLDELTGDLRARLSWELDRINREINRKLREAGAQESQRVADVQIEAARRYQHEVASGALDWGLPADELSRQTEELRQRIIEQPLSEETRASQERLRALSETLENQEQEAIAQVERGLREKARERRSYSTAAGRHLQTRLADRIEQFSAAVAQFAEPTVGELPGNSEPLAAASQRQAASGEYQRAASAQVERLIARQSALTVAIEQATRRAARRVAWEQNLDLHLLPGDNPVGEDLTSVITEKLTAIWAREASVP